MIPASRALTRLVRTGSAAALATLLIALPGCGEDGSATAEGAAVAAKAAAAAETGAQPGPAAKTAGAAVKPIASSDRCRQQLGGFLVAMETLRERLLAGLSYEQYAEEIELIRASYDEVPVDDLALRCIAGSGTPGERAFGRYIGAANTWGECIGESGCDAPAIEPVLQEQWRAAARLLEEARRGLGG